MKKLYLLFALLSSFACTLNPLPTPPADAGPDAGASAEPGLSFWRWGDAADQDRLQHALDCAISRIRAATCLPVDISYDAPHLVKLAWQAEVGAGRRASTYGASWDATRIIIHRSESDPNLCSLLVHEIAQHVLRRKNDHVLPQLGLHSALVTAVCEVQECGCFNPEGG